MGTSSSRYRAGAARAFAVGAVLGLGLVGAPGAGAATDATYGTTDTASDSYRYNGSWKGKFANLWKQIHQKKVCADGSAGYVDHWVYIHGNDSVYHESGGGTPDYSTGVSLDISRYNSCNGRYTSGFGWVSPDSLGINGSLSSATITASIPMCNYSSAFWSSWALYAGTSKVSVTWTATGPKVSDTFTNTFRSPDFRFRFRFTGVRRTAATTGSVSYLGTTYSLGSPGFASISEWDAKESSRITLDLLPPAGETGAIPSSPPISSCGYGVPVLVTVDPPA